MSKQEVQTNKRLIDLNLSDAQLKEIETSTGTAIRGLAIEQIVESDQLNKIDRGLLTATKVVVCW